MKVKRGRGEQESGPWPCLQWGEALQDLGTRAQKLVRGHGCPFCLVLSHFWRSQPAPSND